MLTRCGRVLQVLLGIILFSAGSPRLKRVASAKTATAKAPTNLDFEDGELGKVPAGWTLETAENSVSAALTPERPYSGTKSAILKGNESRRPPAGKLLQTFDARPYRGTRIVWRAELRGRGCQGFIGLWLRTTRAGSQPGFEASLATRPVQWNDWQEEVISAAVEPDAETISLGLVLSGKGNVWIDSARLDTLPMVAGEEELLPRPVEGNGLENLIQFTKLLGYVRYFHPSDEAAAADWNFFTIASLPKIERQMNPSALAAELEAIFKPLAPTIQVFSDDQTKLAAAAPHCSKRVATNMLSWEHIGYGGYTDSDQISIRRMKTRPACKPSELCQSRMKTTYDLGGGIHARVPRMLCADAQGTLPHTGNLHERSPPLIAALSYSGRYRVTRLAAIILLWNVFEHFYPYFEFVGSDWERELRSALEAAALDADENAFLRTLRRMIAKVNDGHGHVMMGSEARNFRIPLTWEWIQDQLVVIHVDGEAQATARRGDLVKRIDGVSTELAVARMATMVSASTLPGKNYKVMRALESGQRDTGVTLELIGTDSKTRLVTLKRTVPFFPVHHYDDLPTVKEIRPMLYYVDLRRFDADDWATWEQRLTRARGIVFDVRGRPRLITELPPHLMEAPGRSPIIDTPIVTTPDHRDFRFEHGQWTLEPKLPRIQGKTVFLADESAISGSETFLSIIKHYRIGNIIGSTTAGTNGDVSMIALPGLYQVWWTGRRVLNHDGSQFHGIGINPDISVRPTIKGIREGRDEVLERGIIELSKSP